MKDAGKIFKDLLSPRNKIHWRRSDIDYFLSTKGKVVYECFESIQFEGLDKLAEMIKLRNLKYIEKIIICVYADINITFDSFSKIIECVIASIPINQDKTNILTGWIDDERTDTRGISVKLIAIQSKDKKQYKK
jgi:hypothetical protein